MSDTDGAKIEVVVSPNEADYREVLMERSKKKIRDNRFSLSFLFVATVLMTIATYATVGFSNTTMRYCLLILVVLLGLNLVVFGLLFLGIRFEVKRMMDLVESPTTYSFDPNGVRRASQSFSTESSWSRFSKIGETEIALLFFITKDSYVVVPKRFFEGGELPEKLRQLILSNATGEVELLSS